VASYSLPAAGGIHKTLSGTTADTIAVPYVTVGSREIEVLNRSTSNPIYVRVGGSAAVAAADGTTVIPAGTGRVFTIRESAPTISVVGNGDAYSVDWADR